MIAFFPAPYPDELIYSQISRYHQRSGCVRFVFTAEDTYQAGKVVHPSIEFVNKYTDDAMNWLTKDAPWEQVIAEHTMCPSYIRFLPLQRRKEAVEGIINCNGNWKNLMCLPILNEKRYLRYCPECAKDDREKYGETYWHREHQIPRIRVCPKHKMFLENSSIPIGSKSTPGLFDAESNVPKDALQRLCGNQREIEFTQYVLEVFRQSINLEIDNSAGAFLHSKLKDEYKNKSGIIRNMEKLYADYTRFYDGIPTMSQTYMQKIFNGYMYDTYFIPQLAFFEGVSVYDITYIPSRIKEFNELYKQLAEKYNVDYTVVSDIADEILKQKIPKVSNISGPRRREYDRLDEELLPKVKAVVDRIINKDGKPERVSVTKIQRLLKLPQKQFNKLPKCKAYIEKHVELQEQFWGRKVEWAINTIKEGEGVITLSKIMKLTNIRKNDIERSYKGLENSDVKTLISRLVKQ